MVAGVRVGGQYSWRWRRELFEKARRLVEMGIYSDVDEALADLEQGIAIDAPDAVEDGFGMTVVASTPAEARALKLLASGWSSERVAKLLARDIAIQCIEKQLFRKRGMCSNCFFRSICLVWRDRERAIAELAKRGLLSRAQPIVEKGAPELQAKRA